MGYLRFLAAHPRFLAFGFTLAFFSSFGQTFFISVFGDEIRGAFDLSHRDYGLCYSLATLASGFTILWVGRTLDFIDLRVFSVAVCAGLAVACGAMAVAPTVVLLAAALFLLRLTGQGLLSHTSMTSMARYFDEERGKATSIAGLGFPAGEAVLPVLAVMAIAGVGWRGAWLGLACILGLAAVPLVLGLLRGHAARHRAHLGAIEARDDASAPASGRPGPAPRHWTVAEVLRDPAFHLIVVAVMAPGFLVTGIFFHHVHLVAERAWSLSWFAGCFAVFAAAQLPAGLLAGPLVDRVGATRLLPLFLVPLSLGLVVLGASRHMATAPAFMALAGLTSGIAGPIVGSMWAEVYGVRHLGAIRALVTSILVFGTALSPVSMGWLIDAGVSMDVIAFLGAGYAATGVVLAGIAVARVRRRSVM